MLGRDTQSHCLRCFVANPFLAEPTKNIYAALSRSRAFRRRSFGRHRLGPFSRPSSLRHDANVSHTKPTHSVRGVPGGLIGGIMDSTSSPIAGMSMDTDQKRSVSSSSSEKTGRYPNPLPSSSNVMVATQSPSQPMPRVSVDANQASSHVQRKNWLFPASSSQPAVPSPQMSKAPSHDLLTSPVTSDASVSSRVGTSTSSSSLQNNKRPLDSSHSLPRAPSLNSMPAGHVGPSHVPQASEPNPHSSMSTTVTSSVSSSSFRSTRQPAGHPPAMLTTPAQMAAPHPSPSSNGAASLSMPTAAPEGIIRSPFIWNRKHKYWQIQDSSGKRKAACTYCKDNGKASLAFCLQRMCAACYCDCPKHVKAYRKKNLQDKRKRRKLASGDHGTFNTLSCFVFGKLVSAVFDRR